MAYSLYNTDVSPTNNEGDNFSSGAAVFSQLIGNYLEIESLFELKS